MRRTRHDRSTGSRGKETDSIRLALRALNATTLGLVVTDNHRRILLTNPAFTRVTGYAAEEVRGRDTCVLQSGRHDEGFYEEIWRRIETTGAWSGEIWIRRKSGEAHPEWLTINAIRDSRGRVVSFVGVFFDIGDRIELEQQLIRRAYSDPLTGLPNRALLADRFARSLAYARRNYWLMAMLLIDLDDFKSINDREGHAFGDRVLTSVGRALRRSVRESDTVSRIGGDEFVALLVRIDQPADAGLAARKILRVFRSRGRIDGRKVAVHASIGISIYPDDGVELSGLIEAADKAMYEAKRDGKRCYRFYEPRGRNKAKRDAPRRSILTATTSKHPHRPIGRRTVSVSACQFVDR